MNQGRGFGLRRIGGVILSFETAFVLFLFAGRYKNDPSLAWIPVDLTVLFLVVSVLAGAWVLYKRVGHFRPEALVLTGLVVAFIAYAAASYIWTPSRQYATQKLGYLTVLTLWPFLACTIIVGYSRRRLGRLALVIVALSIWFVVETFAAYLAVGSAGRQIEALGIQYLGIGRVIGPAALILATYGTIIGRRAKLRAAALLLFGCYSAALLALGGRGPFLATVLPLLILVFLSVEFEFPRAMLRIRPGIVAFSVFVAGAFGFVIYYGGGEALSTLRRLDVMLVQLDRSVGVRLEMYREAVRIWGEHPFFGAGIASWPVLAGWGDVRMYPHNLFLEVVSEFGLVGLALMLLSFTYALFYAVRRLSLRHDAWTIMTLMLFANALLNAMFTGDLTDNRIVFAFLGLLVARGRGDDWSGLTLTAADDAK